MLLARYMTASSRDDYSYMRPSRREGDAIFPSLRSAQTEMIVVLDTSGSIKADEMQEFVTEIDAIKGQVRALVTLHACDAALSSEGPWVFEPWEEFELPKKLRGGGGTRFTPVFEWVETQGVCPDLLVYFTDAEGEFPKLEPRYPVIWLVKGRGKVPWGQRIQLN
jgi:predicted metal-dependent peptidase